ncbi:hypothetical protein AVEN_3475-1 [Araneus ventricosus]|uniref:Uncharacterized protein n=1 Tax=Araneus ventricosus TaxID=182803 RepID=A0A4Y2Q6W3_ARAVE|nr:hypothetical protein AVEN_266638-1 [Araneus ventricosus]GBN59015.1 hypothetical protein AVEN_59066-1 [Araneus ventricosus]GBN59309.1 hypothetical protein AVEN_3475-1 [Araneus ventricosus]
MAVKYCTFTFRDRFRRIPQMLSSSLRAYSAKVWVIGFTGLGARTSTESRLRPDFQIRSRESNPKLESTLSPNLPLESKFQLRNTFGHAL